MARQRWLLHRCEKRRSRREANGENRGLLYRGSSAQGNLRCADARPANAHGANKLTPKDVDLFEINEAFAAQILTNITQLGIPEDKLNICGGGRAGPPNRRKQRSRAHDAAASDAANRRAASPACAWAAETQ